MGVRILAVPNRCADPAAPMMAASGADSLIGRPMIEVEKYYTAKALELCADNRSAAAELLGMSERTLYRKLQEWKKEEK